MINDVKGLKLLDLLKGENRRFVIPEYQRDYKWGKEEISQFITDIFEAYDDYKKKSDYNYFFGAVITEKQKIPTVNGFNEYHLIDGQQRITTSILFVKILQQLYLKEIKGQDVGSNEDIQEILVDLRQALWVDGKEKNRFCKLVSKKDGDSRNLEEVLVKKDDEVDSNINTDHNFYKNYKLLEEEYSKSLNEQENFKLDGFIKFVFNNLEFVQVDTSSREAALKIFSVLNTRGLDLSSTDIIKAEAMATLSQEKHRDFFSKWKELESKADYLDVNFETLFRYYINMYLPTSVKGTNDINIKTIWGYEKFKNDKFLALKDFEKYITCFEYIWNFNDPYIWCLRHLLVMGKNAYTWIPVLATMKYNEYSDDDIRAVAKFITKWHWIHLVFGWTVEKIKAFNFALIKSVNEKKTIQEILETKPRIVSYDGESEDALLDRFARRLKYEDIYHTRWGRPLLFFLHNLEILQHDGEEQNFVFKSLTKDDTVEHVRPQNSDNEAWIKCSRENKNLIGNLLILSRSRNSSVGTSLDKKSEAYLKVLYAFTPELSQQNPWSDERIDERSNELIEVLCSALDIPFNLL